MTARLRPDVTLEDKYARTTGRVFLTANQALVRLLLDQARRDRAAGLATAGYVSGYRGSPLGVFDAALWTARNHLEAHQVFFQPGLNEELAVSAIRGTQQIAWFGRSPYQGVFGLWYGKGVGVDRACEALKLANLEGTSAHGGVLAVAGDDHGGKSSDSAHQSEQTLAAAMLPILYPSDVAEILELGLAGFALSRTSGCYVALKTVTDTLDLSATVDLPDLTRPFVTPPEIAVPPGGLHLRENRPPLEEERLLVEYRLPAATAFARANGLDRVVVDGPLRELAVVAAGKAYRDLRQALADLGLAEADLRRLGIRLYKPALIWPLDGDSLARFAAGSRALLVVEEKRPFLEEQIARALYGLPADRRPALAGKADLAGRPLLPASGELDPLAVARALLRLLEQLGVRDEALARRAAELEARAERAARVGSGAVRPAWFCAGCPHNTSTRLPEGSRAMGGIGCHGLAAVVMDRDTMQFLPMGHEGTAWIGASRFVDTPHFFQNLGDGTYSHSGILAIRAAVAAGVNLTYKILWNDAVAMTGGQPVEQATGPLGVVRQLLAEGVRRVCLVSDDPRRHRGVRLPRGASLHHRDELDAVQRRLRALPGVTAIVYEQVCATELRRRRKRGLAPEAPRRPYIHPEVCEGCGDCSAQSNCVSIQPLPTEFGLKRRIDQSGCNQDLSCLKGFCPSFVTVEGARPQDRRSAGAADLAARAARLSEPVPPPLGEAGKSLLIAGIGGTGVLTAAAVIAMASHLEGHAATVLDHTGMAQKGGAVTSHLRIAADPAALHAPRIGLGQCDLLLACDLVVAAGRPVLSTVAPGRTAAVVNLDVAATGDFQQGGGIPDGAALRRAVEEALAGGPSHPLNATRIAEAVCGDAIGTNLVVLGYALQCGLLPVSRAALEEAIRLNGVAVEANLRLLAAGRLAAAAPEAIAELLDEAGSPPPLDTFEQVVASRVRRLTAWQDRAWAERYRSWVDEVRRAARERVGEAGDAFAKEVALAMGRLMSYKDEYEVARLYADPGFHTALVRELPGGRRLRVHLAPPFLPGHDPSGRPRKRAFGPWVFPLFRLLARLRFLRGTPFDPFGWSRERRTERRLIEEYQALVEEILPRLTADNLDAACALAASAQRIAGFGPVKEAAIAAWRAEVSKLRARLASPDGTEPLRAAG
ncbi:MAG: indolepyruvate ferredoxin oxidoreductase [Porticoccaceae bacterium]|nr:MAG: indolepyruvate ferredoxin oxidoreductase [Porticoccaceae bacterium]